MMSPPCAYPLVNVPDGIRICVHMIPHRIVGGVNKVHVATTQGRGWQRIVRLPVQNRLRWLS